MVEKMDSEFEATITLVKVRNTDALPGHMTKLSYC